MNNTVKRLLSALMALCMVFSVMVGVLSTQHVHADDTENDQPSDTATVPTTTPGDVPTVDVAVNSAEEARNNTFTSQAAKFNAMTSYITAYGYEIRAFAATGEVGIKNLKTGEIILTNPYDANKTLSSKPGSGTSSTTFENVMSQIIIDYTDTTGVNKNLTSFKNAAVDSQIKISYVKNGISVDYEIGRTDSRRLCPMKVSRDFMETQIFGFIEDDNDLKGISRFYTLRDSFNKDYPPSVIEKWIKEDPILAKMELYTLPDNSSEYNKNRIEAILKKWCPHITYEVIEEQHTLTQYVAKTSVLPCFRLSLVYQLDEMGLSVKLPSNSIVFNEEYFTLKNMTVLPYFGAANGENNNGFTFLPDGTGSIIEFEDVGTRSLTLSGTLYGADYSYHTLPTSFSGKSEAMRFPVFGIKEDKVTVYKYYDDGDGDKSNDKLMCTNHTLVDKITAPTCTEDGFTIQECTACPYKSAPMNIVAAAHTYNEEDPSSVEKVPTTCQTLGYEKYTCTVCGDVNVINATEYADHAFGALTKVERGVVEYTCTLCNYTYRTEHKHNYSSIGEYKGECAESGEYAPAKPMGYAYQNGKLYIVVSVVEYGKFREGMAIKFGDVTGTISDLTLKHYSKAQITELFKDVADEDKSLAGIDAFRRIVVEVTISKADFAKVLEAGDVSYVIEKKQGVAFGIDYCATCDMTNIVFKASDNHKYVKDEKQSVVASCKDQTNGKTVYVCSDCETTKEVEVAWDSVHTFDTPKATGKFWTSTDKTEIVEKGDPNALYEIYEYTCKTCNAKVEKALNCTDAKIEHEYDETIVIEGDCNSLREVSKVCKICGVKTVVRELGHNVKETVIKNTCTEQGYSVFECTECDYRVVKNFTDPAHDYEVKSVEYTCTEDGYTEYKCKACGETKKVIDHEAAHKYNETVVPFTCTTPGYTECVCTVCGEKTVKDETPADHTWSKGIIFKAATVTEDGFRRYFCTKCTEGQKDEVIPALGMGSLDYYTVEKVTPEGFLAVLTEGESYVNIVSSHGGALHPYHSIYITLNPRPSDTYNLADSLSVGADAAWTVVSERKYTGNFTMRILMVSDSDETHPATVSGMAAAYRDYLKANGTLEKLVFEDENIPLYIEALGETNVSTTVLSFPVSKSTALTTFKDLEKIVTDLNGKGITNIDFRLTGFANGGLETLPSTKVDFEKVLGGNKGYSEFLKFAEEKGVGVYPEFEYSYVNRVGLFDGYSDSKHAIKTIDGRYIFKTEYDPVMQVLASSYSLAVSPSVFMGFYEGLYDDLSDLGIMGISSGSLGTDLNSDFDEDEPYNREDTKKFVVDLLAQMEKDTNGNLMVDGGNAYSYGYVKHILNMSLTGSNYLRMSASVPFISMVLHSYISYSGTPTNRVGNERKEILRMIENGASPYFVFCVQNSAVLKESHSLSDNYSVDYNIWMKQEEGSITNVIDIYNRVNEALKDVKDAEFVMHDVLIGERVRTKLEQEKYDKQMAEKIEELKEKAEIAQTEFDRSVSLYVRLAREGREENLQAYFDNANAKRVARDMAEASYKEALDQKENDAGYDENGNYVSTEFTIDNGTIVYTEYSNGVYFVLNYNNFPVTVELNGETIQVGVMDFYKGNIGG